MAELRCEELVKRYGKRAVLDGVDLHVPEGTLTAILGASGSGKTTLLRVVMGLLGPDAGRVLVGGTLVADGATVDVVPNKRSLGYVAQEGALFPHLTVGENIGFGLPRAERRRGTRLAEVLELVGLSPAYRDRRPHELSGGEQRRVALARALAPRPRLVLLDEPFSGLDAALRAGTRQAVLHALAQEGATAVLVTHDQAEALSMGREVGVLREGKLVQSGPPATLYQQPVDVHLARFLGEAVVVAGTAEAGRIVCGLGDLQPQPAVADLEGAVDVMVRPEQLVVRRVGDSEAGLPGDGEEGLPGGEPGESSRVSATVAAHTFYGPHTVLELTLHDRTRTPVRASTSGRELPQIGEVVRVGVCGAVMAYAPHPDGRAPGEGQRAEGRAQHELARAAG